MEKTVIQLQEDRPMSCGTLCIFNKDGLTAEEHIEDTVTIGRVYPGMASDITIDSKIVSKNHGIIKKTEGSFVYEDVNDANGTFINGRKYGKTSADGRSSKVLKSGDVLRIDQNNLQKMHPFAVAMIFFAGRVSYQWTELSLEDKSVLEIGRRVSPKRGLSFDDAAASRKHACFVKGLHYWQIIDYDSTNGVYLNNERIQQPEILNPMDAVRIANITFLFLGDKILYNRPEKQQTDLVIHIRRRTAGFLFSRKILLEDIQLSVQAGEMILILGGSGAGKTTFMNAVLGYEKADGKISHEGLDLYRDYAKLKGEIGFVDQKILLRQDDDVYSTLLDAAEMKLAGCSRDVCQKRVEEVLTMLGLQSEKTTLVRKLSGGQARRLAIGVELISDPVLFFLDEPDSGLDGTNAISLMRNLRVIADEGKIVMIISHQPNRVAELFDKVVVIAKGRSTKGGTLAFFGTVDETYDFFDCQTLEEVTKRINPADEGGDGKADEYIALFRKHREKM